MSCRAEWCLEIPTRWASTQAHGFRASSGARCPRRAARRRFCPRLGSGAAQRRQSRGSDSPADHGSYRAGRRRSGALAAEPVRRQDDASAAQADRRGRRKFRAAWSGASSARFRARIGKLPMRRLVRGRLDARSISSPATTSSMSPSAGPAPPRAHSLGRDAHAERRSCSMPAAWSSTRSVGNDVRIPPRNCPSRSMTSEVKEDGERGLIMDVKPNGSSASMPAPTTWSRTTARSMRPSAPTSRSRPGKLTEAPCQHRAAKITLKLVRRRAAKRSPTPPGRS